jgi:hypothetical protein
MERSRLEEGDRRSHGPKTGLVAIEEKENYDKERFQAKQQMSSCRIQLYFHMYVAIKGKILVFLWGLE